MKRLHIKISCSSKRNNYAKFNLLIFCSINLFKGVIKMTGVNYSGNKNYGDEIQGCQKNNYGVILNDERCKKSQFCYFAVVMNFPDVQTIRDLWNNVEHSAGMKQAEQEFVQ